MSRQSDRWARISYYVSKISGLAPVTIKNKRLCDGSLSDILYPLVLCVVLISANVLIALNNTSTWGLRHISVHSVSMMMIFITSLGSNVMCIVQFVVKRKKILQISRLFLRIDRSFRSFGIEQNYEKKFKFHVILMGLFHLFIIITELSGHGIMWKRYKELKSLIQNDAHILAFLHVTKHQSTFMLVIAMDLMNERLSQIVDRLLDLCDLNHENRPFVRRNDLAIDINVLNMILMGANAAPGNALEIWVMESQWAPTQHQVTKIGQLCIWLNDLTNTTMELLSLPFLATTINDFAVGLATSYDVFRTIQRLEMKIELLEACFVTVLIFHSTMVLLKCIAVAVAGDSIRKTVRHHMTHIHTYN